MRKGHDITGLRVIGRNDGGELGRVLDLVFDTNADECVGLIMRERGTFHDAEVIPWEQIEAIGPDALIVRGEDSKVRLAEAPRIRAAMEQEFHLTGHRILTTDGKELGSFGDVFLDEKSGRVLGYEVSGGFVSDTMSGKRYISAVAGPDIGRDVVLVPPSVKGELESQADGGLKGAAQSAGAKVADVYDAAKDKVVQTYSNIAEASIDKQKEFIVGKAASRDVFLPSATNTPTEVKAFEGTSQPSSAVDVAPASMSSTRGESNYFVEENTDGSLAVRPRRRDFQEAIADSATRGELLVRQGETISREHADKAESAGILHELVLAAGASVANESYEAARDRVVQAKDEAQGQLAKTTGDVQQSAEEAAIGKEAGAEVRLADGSILVAPGMIITQGQMETAKRQGKDKELIAAAGLGVAANTAQNLGTSAQEKATGLFETMREKFNELTGAAGEKKEEFDEAREQSAVNHAIGRPIDRVLLAQDDTIILNTGDIITHKSIEQARQEGVLDILLNSVAEVQAEITPEMLRVEGKGSAALPTQPQWGVSQDQQGTPSPNGAVVPTSER